ncbi:hypothetical protein HGA88_02695 [Candidatus Roizmanbacteria bacterium]|nr:hypothetical protein [Candidatus Roizmanbacteria bacterium]
MTGIEKIKNTLLWGVVLWFIGYVAGMVLFFIVPKDLIGIVITPFATLVTMWVLLDKIKRPELKCYFGLGFVWSVMAILLDYIFIVTLLKTGTAYYKPDVFLYYALTLALPIAVGYWKYKHKSSKQILF